MEKESILCLVIRLEHLDLANQYVWTFIKIDQELVEPLQYFKHYCDAKSSEKQKGSL